MSENTQDNSLEVSPIERTDEAMANNPGGLDAPMIAFVGVIGIVLVFVIVVATQAWVYSQENLDNENNRYRETFPTVEAYKAEQHMKLNTVRYHIIDEEVKVVVPIDKAMQQFVNDEEFRKFSDLPLQ